MIRFCEISECDREHSAKGLCDMHYLRLRRTGSVGEAAAVKKMPARGLTLAEHLWANVDRTGGPAACWPFRGELGRGGYGRFQHDLRKLLAHRAAWEVTHGEIPEGQMIRHKVCDNPPCCNPAHLRPGTPLQNMRDKVDAGRHVVRSGSANAAALLDERQVKQIRSLHASGARQVAIAGRFGVSASLISRIVRRELWKDVA